MRQDAVDVIDFKRAADALRLLPRPGMKCLMKSWLRPSNSSASVTSPSGASKTYSLSIFTHGNARRSAAN
jgi:hypothetical protein